jgi:hypothetical protein
MQKFASQDGVEQPYKLASQIELWTLLWPNFFIKLSCSFPLLEFVHVLIKFAQWT